MEYGNKDGLIAIADTIESDNFNQLFPKTVIKLFAIAIFTLISLKWYDMDRI